MLSWRSTSICVGVNLLSQLLTFHWLRKSHFFFFFKTYLGFLRRIGTCNSSVVLNGAQRLCGKGSTGVWRPLPGRPWARGLSWCVCCFVLAPSLKFYHCVLSSSFPALSFLFVSHSFRLLTTQFDLSWSIVGPAVAFVMRCSVPQFFLSLLRFHPLSCSSFSLFSKSEVLTLSDLPYCYHTWQRSQSALAQRSSWGPGNSQILRISRP